MRVLAALLFAFALCGLAWAEPMQGRWPGGRAAAIALTYDDALASQLDVAIPQLDAAGLKGTFFLTGTFAQGQVERWRAAAAGGHELGNHTVFHPCLAGTYEMPPQRHLENYSVATMLAEIAVMNTMLAAIDGKEAHAFATPCGHNLAGGEDYVGPLQQSGMARHIRDARAMPASPPGLPPITGTGFSDVDGAAMIAWVETVRRSGGAGVIVFHGVGGDYISVSAQAHRELVAHLQAHEREIWTAPYSELIDYIVAPPASN